MKKFSIVTLAIILAITLAFVIATPSFASDYNGCCPEEANAKSDAKAGASALVNNISESKRGFANPAIINYPGLPGYFGTSTPGSSFQSLQTLLAYKDTFTTDELLKMSKGDAFGSKVIVTPLTNEVKDDVKADNVKMLLTKPSSKATLVGYITVKATSDGTVSAEVMAEAMLAARDLGANTVHVTSEGVERVLKAFGWGVGISYTRATMNSDESAGGVAAGGTGISGGTAGYKDRPWLQLFALITE